MKLGEYQKLKVIKKVEFGVYLAEHEGDETRVLLPQKQVPADAKLGDEIEVFLYKDSKDRIIATTNQPKLTLGGLADWRCLRLPRLEKSVRSWTGDLKKTCFFHIKR